MSNRPAAGRTLEWAQVDVFADAALEGNMLAIFTDANGLTNGQMQALARETNLSETTFILPRPEQVEREQGVRVRIFTVEEELPFAGHPTLGTASWLRLHNPAWQGAEHIVLDLNTGRVPVRFAQSLAPDGSIIGEMTQNDPHFGAELDPAELAPALGLAQADLHATLPPQVVSTGLPFAIAPLASASALARLRVDRPRLDTLLHAAGAKFVYAIAQVEPMAWEARMPFHATEDPATGSAAGCAISYLVARGAAPASALVEVQQGKHIHRPSRIFAQADLQAGTVRNVRVSGRTIPVATGRFLLR